ncbi:MAG: hypothetical protein ABL907_00125, partial [Hyphomicrobium sp.]
PEELREKQAKAVQAMENPTAAAAAQKAINLEAAGLGKRDYIPLAIAIFVDFCLLMVSFGRPANRFARTAMELKAAELGPQSAIVGINREVHEDRIIRRNFELFHRVVVHFGNHYLAAVPLAAPHKAPDGRALTPQERERLQIDAQTLVTLFSGLELNSAIVDRGLPPFISLMGGARLIRNRLLKQESKFAHSGAFRFYRFRNRAWPEMILGTVMGTAKKYHHELAERRAEEAVIERESRQIEAEERKAANAQRKAENAQRIAEAELRTMEAQMRQREIEGQLHEAARMRGQMAAQRPMAPMPPHLAAMAGRGGSRSVGAHPGQTGHPAHGHEVHGHHASGPGMAPAPGPFGRTATAAVFPQPAPVQPVHHMPHHVAPHHVPATPAGHGFVEPANHNTAPPERGRMPAGFGVVGAPLGDPRALPANVVPMPERLERTHPGEPPATAAAPPGRETASMEMAHAAFTRMQGAAPPAMTPAVGSHSLPAVVAPGVHQAEVSKSTAPVPHMAAAPMPSARAVNDEVAPDRSAFSPDTDLSSLLRTVAVTQMRVAHDVAQAVHRIESHQVDLDRRTGDSSIAGPADGQMIDAVAEPQVGRIQDHPATHPGRGLAHDPHFDDAGSIAARYAPAQRPQ